MYLVEWSSVSRRSTLIVCLRSGPGASCGLPRIVTVRPPPPPRLTSPGSLQGEPHPQPPPRHRPQTGGRVVRSPTGRGSLTFAEDPAQPSPAPPSFPPLRHTSSPFARSTPAPDQCFTRSSSTPGRAAGAPRRVLSQGRGPQDMGSKPSLALGIRGVCCNTNRAARVRSMRAIGRAG